MNLVSSKVIKSSRMAVTRTAETVQVFSCQLFINSFKISFRGFVYFIWMTDSAQISSLRYEATGKQVQVKETLTMNLRIPVKNGKEAQFNTYLKLMSEGGEEIDQLQIPMNKVTAHFKDMELPLDRGLCILKLRRKQMNLGDDVQVSHPRLLYRSRNIKIDDKSMISGQYQSLQEELNRVKKELQDQLYLNNKLKNDRDVLMATKQELQHQIDSLSIQIIKEIKVLREHYDSRISIREHAYQEQIQNLVNMFNTDAQHNKKVVEMLMKNKIKSEDDLKEFYQKLKYYQLEMQTKSQLIEQLEIKIKQHQESLVKFSKQVKELQEKVEKLEEKNINLNSQKEQIESANVELKELVQSKEKSLGEAHQKIQELNLEIKDKQIKIIALEEALSSSKERQQGSQREKQLLKKEVQLLEEEKNTLNEQIQTLNGKLEEFGFEMEFNENLIGQMKNQHMEKEAQLYLQIENLEGIYKHKLEEVLASYEQEKGKIESNNQQIQKERIQLQSKLKDIQRQADGSEFKIKELSEHLLQAEKELQEKAKQLQSKQAKITQLQEDVKKLSEQEAKKPQVMSKRSSMEGQKAMDSEELNILKQRIKDLEHQNIELQNECRQVKAMSVAKENQLSQLQQQLKKVEQTETLKRSGSHRGASNEHFESLVAGKDDQIHALQRQVQQLQNLYQYIQTRLDKVIQMYPMIDLNKLDAELQVIQCCDSERQEEIQLNRRVSQNQQYIPDLPSPTRKQSLANEVVTPQHDKTSFDRKQQEFIPRSDPKILDHKVSIGQQENQLDRESNHLSKVSKDDKSPTERVSLRRLNSITVSIRENQSQVSGVSKIKVSHTKKIKQLQDTVQALQRKLLEYQQEIGANRELINSMQQELCTVKQLKLPIHSPEVISPTFRNDKQTEKSEKVIKVEKKNMQSQVIMEDYRINNLVQECKLKDNDIFEKQLKIKDMEKQINQTRALREENISKIIILEQKSSQAERRQSQWHKQFDTLAEANKQLVRDMVEMEEKLRKQKQNLQDARLAHKELNMHHENSLSELKKLRNQNETLEEKVQKMAGSDLVIRQLSKEIQDGSKKILELTRTINHLKLEKDAVDEQLRLFKKRQNDQIRIATEWEEKASSLERTIEEMKRKESKLKRQIEDGQQDVRRGKLQQKKLQDELQVLNTAQVAWQVERRKYLDEISTLQDQLTRKDYDLNKLTKEIDRWKARAEEKEDVRMGKKSELREQIERLQNEMIRKEKKLFEEVQENKLLRGRLQLLERQNKRMLDQKNQTYGQKLRYYVDQMGSIKKLLEEYQNDNSRLKIDNNELYQQYEMIRSNYDKLQLRYDEGIDREQAIMNDLQQHIDETNLLKDKLGVASSDIQQLENAFANLRKEAEEERIRTRRLNQKLQNTERQFDLTLTQNRDLKLRISEYETNYEISSKIGERYKQLERKKTQLDDEHRRLKTQNDSLKCTYVYTREDLQTAVSQTKTQQKRLKDEQVQRVEQECNRAIVIKTQRLEQELLDVYNQSNRTRNDFQVTLEENARMKGRIIELQILSERVSSLQAENQQQRGVIQQLQEELKRRNQKISKIQLQIQSIESEYNFKERELSGFKGRFSELQQTIQRLNEQIKGRRSTERQLQEALIRATDKKGKQKNDDEDRYKQKQVQIVKEYQTKIASYEKELQKGKEKEARSIEDNNLKMKKLQQKMDEMEEALKEKQKAIEGHYQSEMRQLQHSLFSLSEQLKEKLALIDQLNEAIIVLEGDNVDLSKQLQEFNFKHDQERNLLEQELNRLKNKFKQTEAAYTTNLKTLEDEVHRVTQTKLNTSNSRFKTNQAEDRVAKRYEDKLKTKDKKIQELKENIYTLEETILKMKKKQTSNQVHVTELEKLKIVILQSEKDKKKMEQEWQSQLTKHSELIRELKKEILRLREEEQTARLMTEEKLLQNESLACELKTVRELYQELQRELERRKNNLTLQLQEENSLQYQLSTRQSKILELEEKVLQYTKTVKAYQLQQKKKNNQLKKQQETIDRMMHMEKQYTAEIQRLTAEVSAVKKSVDELNTTCESAKSQLKYSKAQVARLRKVQQDLRQSFQNGQEASAELKRINQELIVRYRQCEDAARRYSLLNERSRDELGITLDELIDQYSMILETREAETNELIQEIEQLKFLNQRKYLDYDQIKKQNFELQLKVQQYESISDQVEQLRRICDKLQEQKKNCIFREEVLRMQIQNLAGSAPLDLKERIDSILRSGTVPTYANFSFY